MPLTCVEELLDIIKFYELISEVCLNQGSENCGQQTNCDPRVRFYFEWNVARERNGCCPRPYKCSLPNKTFSQSILFSKMMLLVFFNLNHWKAFKTH